MCVQEPRLECQVSFWVWCSRIVVFYARMPFLSPRERLITSILSLSIHTKYQNYSSKNYRRLLNLEIRANHAGRTYSTYSFAWSGYLVLVPRCHVVKSDLALEARK